MDEVDADELFTTVHPDYFATQRKDLWYCERLWSVLLRQLEKRTSGRRLTEFGSGPGFLLKLAERRGWDAVGVEPSALARAHAERLGVRSSERPFDLWTDDAIIATEVLEHLDDPQKTLLAWREVLFDGGFLALSVPNDNNPLQRLFWGKSKPWLHHTHKSYFNPKSLKALVESCGFEVVWQRTSFPVELLLILPIPRKWAWKLSRLWPAPPLLWRFGIGRHVLMVARKVG
jgi:SAM-dependent methyltransferase